jgi:hypothetical protein
MIIETKLGWKLESLNVVLEYLTIAAPPVHGWDLAAHFQDSLLIIAKCLKEEAFGGPGKHAEGKDDQPQVFSGMFRMFALLPLGCPLGYPPFDIRWMFYSPCVVFLYMVAGPHVLFRSLGRSLGCCSLWRRRRSLAIGLSEDGLWCR